ncbi:MAG: hypothetical protein ACREHG_07860 [Candidatus Saccharimonadales bacterium]
MDDRRSSMMGRDRVTERNLWLGAEEAGVMPKRLDETVAPSGAFDVPG